MKKLFLLILLGLSLQSFSQSYNFQRSEDSYGEVVLMGIGITWTTISIATEPSKRWVPNSTSPGGGYQSAGYANGGPIKNANGKWVDHDPWRNINIGIGITITITGILTAITKNT